jgi:DNA polymerase III delta prime subunit
MLALHQLQCENIAAMLERGVQTLLLVGDHGVGKKTLVNRAVQTPDSRYVLIPVAKLGVDDARALKHEVLRASRFPRVYLIDGDEATEAGYNALLKTLEEPPKNAIFVICSSRVPLPTVVSRCHYVMIPPLTEDELKQVLSFKGMSERAAASIIPYARGSVSEAYKVYEKMEEKRRLVPFIKALKDRDLSFVLRQVKEIRRDDIVTMMELVDDVFLSRYGLLSTELGNIIPASPDFLIRLKEALQGGSSPAICWMRAWYSTGS